MNRTIVQGVVCVVGLGVAGSGHAALQDLYDAIGVVPVNAARAAYNPFTGEVAVVANQVALVALRSKSGLPAFSPDAVSLLSTPNNFGGLATLDFRPDLGGTEIAWVTSANALGVLPSPGDRVGGAIVTLPPVDASDLEFIFQLAGAPPESFDLGSSAFVLVPEPGVAALAALGAGAMLRRRRAA